MKKQNIKQNIVIIPDVRSVENVGAMFRTCDAAGVKKIYLTGYSPTPMDRFGRKRNDLAKSALGAEDNVPWEQKKNLSVLLKKLKKDGYVIVAIEQDKRSVNFKSLNKNYKTQNFVFVVGNEVAGIPKNILNKCDVIVEIPMHGKKESLNVSVALGIVLFSSL